MVDSGAPPGESVAIESACNGSYRTEGYTDGKGRFSVRLGERNNGIAQDATAGSGFGAARGYSSGPAGGTTNERRLEGCELRARLPGYQSETVPLNGRLEDQSDIGVIFLHRLGRADGMVVSMTSLAAPKAAQKALQKSREALAKGKREDARKSLEKATRIDPQYAVAWFELGELQLLEGDPPGARASFEAAIRADAKFVRPYVALAVLQGAAKEWAQLEETTARAIALDPYGSPRMYMYNAVARYTRHDLEGAEKNVREAERLDKNRDLVGAWELLGSILASRRDFAGAAEQYRAYLALAPHAPDAAEVRTRLDRMERLSARASAPAPAR